MGWMFSLTLFIAWARTHNDALIIASGLFAIAGAIGLGFASVRQDKEKE